MTASLKVTKHVKTIWSRLGCRAITKYIGFVCSSNQPRVVLCDMFPQNAWFMPHRNNFCTEYVKPTRASQFSFQFEEREIAIIDVLRAIMM